VIVRQGATRTVLLTRRHAIKVPRPTNWRLFLAGLLANMQERQFARTGWPQLCPVRWSTPGGWLLVMPRCRPLRQPLTQDEYEAFVEHDDYRVPVEWKTDSFGYLAGRLVAIDYGS